ncbi:MAG: DUF72 domain-containing protein [Anaerolineales bacterium]
MKLYVGCPIWSFKGWVGNFYPSGTKPSEFLREYARRLTTIEGNTTFYATPSPKVLAQWAVEMPKTFRFCPKVPRSISHEGTLSAKTDEAAQFIERISLLGDRLGPMFLQLPPAFSPQRMDELRAFLAAWPREIRLGVEVRHLDWFDTPNHEGLNGLLSEYNMARVVIDTRPIRSLTGDASLAGSTYESLLESRERKPDVPVLPERTADFVFIRYIGHPQEEMNRSLLDEWAGFLSEQIRGGAEAFVFCHSPNNLVAPTLCRNLHRSVAAQVEIPSLPWDEADANTFEQGRLF